MRREVTENGKKYWSNKQNDKEEPDELAEVESLTEHAFSA